MRPVAAAICAVVIGGCALVDPEGAEQRARAEIERRESEQARLDSIPAVPGEMTRPYRILGQVSDVGGPLALPCSVESLKRNALERYPETDAVVFVVIDTNPMGTSNCTGTAVAFTD